MKLERYIPPPESKLARSVLAIWRVRAPGGFARETILPKGNVDLIFNLGDPIERVRESRSLGPLASATAYVAGLQTTSFATCPKGHVDVIGLSLRLETCFSLLGTRPAELSGAMIESRLVTRGVDELLPRVQEAPSFRETCELLIRWIGNNDGASNWISAACRSLEEAQSPAPVEALAREHNLSARQVRRRFERDLGIGPAQYVRLKRFVRALYMIPRFLRLTDVAHAAGYHDQAHFSRDFTAIAGMSPNVYRARGAAVPGHLFER